MEALFDTDTVFLGNPLRSWLLAAATAIVVFIALWAAKRLLVRYVAKLSRKTKTYIDDVIRESIARTRTFFVVFVSLYAGSGVLFMTDDVARTINRIVGLVIIVQIGIWGNTAIRTVIDSEAKRRMATDPNSVTTLGALGFVGRLLMWALLVLMALDNFGYDVTALLAGLGIGGIAVALAVQNILGDLLGSLSIVLDKPFEVGDFIIVDDKLGTVERVGLKTTRIRALSGEQLVFANSDLLSARIQNYKRMFERRAVFTIRVKYGTPRHLIEKAAQIIRAAIEAQELARFDRAHFASYAESALLFEAVYYVKEPGYNEYMDTQQAINLHIHAEFDKEGIEFALPARVVTMEGAEAQPE